MLNFEHHQATNTMVDHCTGSVVTNVCLQTVHMSKIFKYYLITRLLSNYIKLHQYQENVFTCKHSL